MSDFVIFTDSAADLPTEFARQGNIRVIPFYVSFDGVNYLKENVDLTHNEFFDKLKQGAMSKTSCPSVSDYLDSFNEALGDGKMVLCICLSSKLSGSYQSACNAAAELNEDGKRVYVIDSLQATATEGLLAAEALSMQRDGKSIDEVYARLEQIKHTAKVYFTLDDLTYLQKGGRIGKAASLVGTLLNIKPLICLEDGELIPIGKVRGRKKAAAEIKAAASKYTESNKAKYRCAAICFPEIGDIDGFGEAVADNAADIDRFAIGVTIGAHTGITAAGIAVMEKA